MYILYQKFSRACTYARVRVRDVPCRAERVAEYLGETGDPNHFFCGPVEVSARFSPHGSPLRALVSRRVADF